HIRGFPKDVQAKLTQLRTAIHEAAPEAEEAIAYGIPTFKFHGNLVHFAGYASHIGFYPGANAIYTFKKELAPYPTAKGTVRFPLDKPIPIALVKKIVKQRVRENSEKKKGK
ncbi:MAG: DUF1801 domain-containing protein, partial [archaeon]